MVAATFLELNGMRFTATEESVVEMTLGLASGKVKEGAYGEWLKENSVKEIFEITESFTAEARRTQRPKTRYLVSYKDRCDRAFDGQTRFDVLVAF